MSRVQTIVLGLAALVGVGWASGCGDGAAEPSPPDPPRPTSVTVTPATADLTALGETVQLRAEVRDQNGQAMAGAAVSWASNPTAMATVNASGLVTAAANGTATITATAGGVSGTATVRVSVGSKVTLDSAEGSAPEGSVVTLGLTLDPVPDSAISVRYTLGVDGDPLTSDADGSDYTDGGGGAVEIAAGASSAAIREAARARADEIRAEREANLAHLNSGIELLERARSEHESLLRLVARFPRALMTEQEIYVFQQSLKASRAANRDLENLGLEPSGESTLALGEEELAHHREVTLLHKDAENLLRDWREAIPERIQDLSSAELSALSGEITNLIARGDDLETRLVRIEQRISGTLRSRD